MTNRQNGLSEKLKSLGFAQEKQMRLYGQDFQFVSDPIFTEGDDTAVFLDAIEKRSRQRRRIRIPLNIVNMASAAA